MTVDEHETRAMGDERPRRARWQWPIVSATVALVFVALLAWVGWTWRHPTALGDRSDHYGFKSTKKPGDPLWVSAVVPAIKGEPKKLQIHSVSPHVTGTSGSDVTAWVCDFDAGHELQPGEHLAFGTGGSDDAEKYCNPLVPAAGADLTLSPDHHQQLLLRIELDRPGVVKVNGADVNYSEGWKTGTETIGPDVVVRVRKAT